jgi:dTDP-4-amino-4,6-dideoxygalactose transaminase
MTRAASLSISALEKKYVNKKIRIKNKNSYEISKNSFCLLSGNNIKYTDQIKIVKILNKIFPLK